MNFISFLINECSSYCNSPDEIISIVWYILSVTGTTYAKIQRQYKQKLTTGRRDEDRVKLRTRKESQKLSWEQRF